MVGAEPVIANRSAGRRVPGHGHLAGVVRSADVIGARVLLGAKLPLGGLAQGAFWYVFFTPFKAFTESETWAD